MGGGGGMELWEVGIQLCEGGGAREGVGGARGGRGGWS